MGWQSLPSIAYPVCITPVLRHANTPALIYLGGWFAPQVKHMEISMSNILKRILCPGNLLNGTHHNQCRTGC